MSQTLLQWTPVLVAAFLAVFTVHTNLRASKTSEKKVTVEEQIAEDAREDVIATRRREELDRLYELRAQDNARLEKLEKKVDELTESDRLKQITIEGLTELLARVRSLFLTFINRVESAWDNGHSMPKLTEIELALLKDVYPYQRSNLLK